MSEPIDWELIELEEGPRVAAEQKRQRDQELIEKIQLWHAAGRPGSPEPQQSSPVESLLRTPEIRNYLVAELAKRHPELRVDQVYAFLDQHLGTVQW